MPAVTRIGDADDIHCSVPTRAEGSPDVFANGIAVSRQGDVGSGTVFINGKGCGRVGDAITGCTSVATGSPNVFSG